MNKEWSEQNKLVAQQLKREVTYQEGIESLLALRTTLFQEILSFRERLCREDFDAIPFLNADGYHSKTIAYSLWHIFRIEDIVAHTLILGDEQVFFSEKYEQRIGAPIITTGNELVGQEIANFSKKLNLDELYEYMTEVKNSTESMLKNLSYQDLKQKISEEDKIRLQISNSVSKEERAEWLIDYWCKKDVRGLIQMPFSRHWIMHLEACLRIMNKIKKK